VSLAERVRRRFARAPEPVRAVVDASADPDERVLAWGELAGGGWLVATSLGLRTVTADGAEDGPVLRWHEVGAARWKAAGAGGSFVVTPLTEVEPGVQSRLADERHVLTDAGELPGVVRRRVDQTVITSRRAPLPGGGSVLLVARRVPGQAAREWTVVFETDEQRSDPAAREAARQKLQEALDAETAG
jgi:hypothetical protein